MTLKEKRIEWKFLLSFYQGEKAVFCLQVTITSPKVKKNNMTK